MRVKLIDGTEKIPLSRDACQGDPIYPKLLIMEIEDALQNLNWKKKTINMT